MKQNIGKFETTIGIDLGRHENDRVDARKLALLARADARLLRPIEHSTAEQRCEVKRLTQVPGAGTLTALTFVLKLGRAERFTRSRDAASYLGLRPRRRQSGERDPHLGITKSGDPYLRKLLVQCAHWILGPFGRDSALRRWGLAKCESGGKRQTLS